MERRQGSQDVLLDVLSKSPFKKPFGAFFFLRDSEVTFGGRTSEFGGATSERSPENVAYFHYFLYYFIVFMKGDIFHILNRGVEKRKIFITEEDYLRFSYNLRDFNNKNNIVFSYSNRIKASSMPFGGATSESSVKPEERLVNILCCCLMSKNNRGLYDAF